MYMLACLVMLLWRDVCHVMEAQEVLTNGLSFFSDGMSLLLVPPPHLSPRLLQIYNQTDGSYMGSPEMSPLYSIVNALTQTAATITLILSFLLSFSLVFSLFLSSCLPSSRDQSLFLPFPSLSILSCFCLAQNKCAHTHTHPRH